MAGLSTELTDITEVEYRQLLLERVVLVSVWTTGSEVDAENAIAELKLLAETAGSQVLEGVVQRRQRPDPATYIGRGKVEELREIVVATGADTVICDGELAPAQLRNLEDRVKVKVIDRTSLILDIFAQHAKSAEGQAQVELAQLQYLKQRLRGWGGNLSRQAGGRASGGAGIGGRGPGETKLETDRRRIHSRIAKLRATLRELDANRQLKRAERQRHQVPSVAIVGYTNAGKSSVLNRLTGAGVLVEDALFATLDPTTRRSQTADGRVYTLTDTVGFVRHLPHDLVEAFASTLGGVGTGRPAGARGRRVRSRPGRSDQGRPRRAGRHRSRRRAGAGGAEQVRSGQCRGHHHPAHRGSGRRGHLGPHRRRDRGAAGRRSSPGCRGPSGRCGCCCRTSGVTWSTGSTSAGSWSAWSTPSTVRW